MARRCVRGGFGKVYQYQQLAVLQTLLQRTVVAPTIAYDTTQVASPAVTGTFPVGPTPEATACLNPVAGPTPGVAVISPACRAFMNARRSAVLAGGSVNNTTAGPLVDGDRRMAYTWAFSVGVKRELSPGLAASVDYVGNRGKANTAIIDINEGPVNPATGRVTRLGVNVFDPDGELVPPPLRGTTFVQFNQNQTTELGSALNTDFNSLEVGLEKRHSNRWSGRVSYTLAHCYDVGSIIVDSNPRLDYGRCDRDNVHAFATSAYVDLGKGFGGGIVFRAYSGYPINETVGTGRQPGRHHQRPADQGRQRHGHAAIGTAGNHRVGRGLERRRRPQRHPRRGADPPRRTVPIHREGQRGSGRAVSRDLQPAESRQLRQPDRRQEFGEFPEDGRGRKWPDGAARIPPDVLACRSGMRSNKESSNSNKESSKLKS